jgi:preprotein translocase subunit SecE
VVVALLLLQRLVGLARFSVLLAASSRGSGRRFHGAGRSMREYLVESQFEMRKVVWPTRDENAATTLVIMVVVVILSLCSG